MRGKATHFPRSWASPRLCLRRRLRFFPALGATFQLAACLPVDSSRPEVTNPCSPPAALRAQTAAMLHFQCSETGRKLLFALKRIMFPVYIYKKEMSLDCMGIKLV